MTEREAQTARPSRFAPYDEQLAKLRADWPAWHIWYVPHSKDGVLTGITWCAQPHPVLNCHSVKDLEEEMTNARIPVRDWSDR